MMWNADKQAIYGGLFGENCCGVPHQVTIAPATSDFSVKLSNSKHAALICRVSNF